MVVRDLNVSHFLETKRRFAMLHLPNSQDGNLTIVLLVHVLLVPRPHYALVFMSVTVGSECVACVGLLWLLEGRRSRAHCRIRIAQWMHPLGL